MIINEMRRACVLLQLDKTMFGGMRDSFILITYFTPVLVHWVTLESWISWVGDLNNFLVNINLRNFHKTQQNSHHKKPILETETKNLFMQFTGRLGPKIDVSAHLLIWMKAIKSETICYIALLLGSQCAMYLPLLAHCPPLVNWSVWFFPIRTIVFASDVAVRRNSIAWAK